MGSPLGDGRSGAPGNVGGKPLNRGERRGQPRPAHAEGRRAGLAGPAVQQGWAGGDRRGRQQEAVPASDGPRPMHPDDEAAPAGSLPSDVSGDSSDNPSAEGS